MKFLLLPFNIAALDIETLSLKTLSPVIDEIGLVFTNVIPIDTPITEKIGVRLWDAGSNDSWRSKPSNEAVVAMNQIVYRQATLRPSVLEQLFDLGRRADEDTIEFRRGVFEKNRAPNSSAPFWGEFENSDQLLPVKAVSDYLFTLWNGYNPQEVWVNHTDFDLPRILTLMEAVGQQEVPWGHRSPKDVSVLRNYLKKTEPLFQQTHDKHPALSEEKTHTGVADARWNLWMVSGFCKYMGWYQEGTEIDLDLED